MRVNRLTVLFVAFAFVTCTDAELPDESLSVLTQGEARITFSMAHLDVLLLFVDERMVLREPSNLIRTLRNDWEQGNTYRHTYISISTHI